MKFFQQCVIDHARESDANAMFATLSACGRIPERVDSGLNIMYHRWSLILEYLRTDPGVFYTSFSAVPLHVSSRAHLDALDRRYRPETRSFGNFDVEIFKHTRQAYEDSTGEGPGALWPLMTDEERWPVLVQEISDRLLSAADVMAAIDDALLLWRSGHEVLLKALRQDGQNHRVPIRVLTAYVEANILEAVLAQRLYPDALNKLGPLIGDHSMEAMELFEASLLLQ